jgi:hypothetical protein
MSPQLVNTCEEKDIQGWYPMLSEDVQKERTLLEQSETRSRPQK